MTTRRRSARWWAPLLVLAGIVAACQPTVTPTADAPAPAPAPTPTPAAPPEPAGPQATCDDLAIRLLDLGAGIHGAIVADTLHMGGAAAPVTCAEPANLALLARLSIPDGYTAQVQQSQSQYYLIVIRYPGGNRLYVISRRGDGTSCVVDTNDRCIAQVTELPDGFDLDDLPDDVAPTIPAGRPAPEPPAATDTAPATAGNPQPRDGATGVAVETLLLSWSAADRAASYDVYWGREEHLAADADLGTPIATTFTATTIRRPALGTTYYWRVDTNNGQGTTTGNVWSFTTADRAAPPPVAPGGGYTPPVVGPPPAEPPPAGEPPTGAPAAVGNPQPRDGATGVTPKTPVLSWSPAAGASSYLVYWGDPARDGNQIYLGPQYLRPNSRLGTPIHTTDTSYTIPLPWLNGLSEFYWRVDAKNDQGTTRGSAWTFHTGALHGHPIGIVDGTLWMSVSGARDDRSSSDFSVVEGTVGTRPGSSRRVLVWVYWRGHTLMPGYETSFKIEYSDVTATGAQGITTGDYERAAESGADYMYRYTQGRVRIVRRGLYGYTGDYGVSLVDDNIKEADETFRVTITPLKHRKALHADATCGQCTVTITIKDDD